LGDLGEGSLVKAIAMARAPLLTVMKSANFLRLAETNALPSNFTAAYGSDPRTFFVAAQEIERRYPGLRLGKDIPYGAVGEYTYLVDRLGEGLKQLMAGSRKFSLDRIRRTDIVSLTPYAEKVTGIETLENMAERVMLPMLEDW